MIGKVIATLLQANTDLTDLVDTNSIYPYVCNENTSLPFIVYIVDSITPIYDKDNWDYDECTFSVESYSKGYAALEDIAYQVREALELKAGTYESIKVRNLRMVSQEEEGFEMAFSNKLTFTIEIIAYE